MKSAATVTCGASRVLRPTDGAIVCDVSFGAKVAKLRVTTAVAADGSLDVKEWEIVE